MATKEKETMIEIMPGWVVLGKFAVNVHNVQILREEPDNKHSMKTYVGMVDDADSFVSDYAFEDVVYAVTEAYALTLPGSNDDDDCEDGSCGCGEDEDEDEDEEDEEEDEEEDLDA